MNSQNYIFTIVVFACHFNYHALSLVPEVPGVQLGTCYRLIDVQERTADGYEYEQLELVRSDKIHICRIRNSPDKFCLVVTKDINGARRAVCHEFHKRDAVFSFLKTMQEETEMFVFRDNLIRWNLSFSAQTYDIIRNIYYNLAEGDRLRIIAMPSDLQKRDNVLCNFAPIATQPLVLIDDRFQNWDVLHVLNTGGNQRGPVLIILKGRMTVFTAEDDKVYMRLREFPEEEYFFTCAGPQEAQELSIVLGRYSVHGRAEPRHDKNVCVIL